MEKSTESVPTISEISTTNNNNSNDDTNDNDGDDGAASPTTPNLKINLEKPDKHNTPIKEVVVPTRNSPSPEVTKWKDIDAPSNDNTKSTPTSNTNTSNLNNTNDGFNWDEAFNSSKHTTNDNDNAFGNFNNNVNNNDDDNYDENIQIKKSLQNIEKSVVSLDNALGLTDGSFAPSSSPSSPSSASASASASDKIKQLELLLKITIDERDSAIRTRAHLEGLLKEKEKENQSLLQKLIETRVELVSNTTKLETSKSEQAKYKHRCSMYASRICKLEVSLVEATLDKQESPRSSKSIASSTPTSSKTRTPLSPTNPFE